MNLYALSSDKDATYKAYASQFKSAYNMIDANVSPRAYEDMMRIVVESFPYYENTNAKVMAVSIYMISKGTSFDPMLALNLTKRIFKDDHQPSLVIDVGRYYKCIKRG